MLHNTHVSLEACCHSRVDNNQMFPDHDSVCVFVPNIHFWAIHIYGFVSGDHFKHNVMNNNFHLPVLSLSLLKEYNKDTQIIKTVLKCDQWGSLIQSQIYNTKSDNRETYKP